ncbi:MAG: T9SS type A sorting domain-containing protein, partial [Candidatus Electryonea clarkiae]|nr:T9SS type A sorting domain-containing protein [Candidatus Electryonea clarkiae]
PLPSEFEIISIYPNPFNSTASIVINLATPERVTISLYNILGRKICVLADRNFSEGSNVLSFQADGLSSGSYIVKATTATNSSDYKKINLLR